MKSSPRSRNVLARAKLVMSLAALFGAGAILTACEPSHIMPYTAKQRAYHEGKYDATDPSLQPSKGSLFSDADRGIFEDTRSARVGDVVLIVIDELADASGDSTTELNRDSTFDMGISNVFGLLTALKAAVPEADPTHMLTYMSKSDFSGKGQTSRKGELKGTIAVRIVKKMPNGDFFLEGTKVILINNEEYHLYVSGLARPSDVTNDNTVPSSRIADAEIEFTGRGDIADQQRKGWLGRGLDKVNPF
ncbi:MAG: flagellar basal body L-ring protein FlgH [Polyangiaceae bacterium]